MRDHQPSPIENNSAGRHRDSRSLSISRGFSGANSSFELQARLARRHFPESDGERDRSVDFGLRGVFLPLPMGEGWGEGLRRRGTIALTLNPLPTAAGIGERYLAETSTGSS